MNPSFDIDVAVTGTQAAELANARPPDLAIVDMHLPGINGATLVRMLRGNSELAHIPILMLSVDTGLDNVLNAINAGSDEFLRKTDVSRKSLLEAIDRISASRALIDAEYKISPPPAEVVDKGPAMQVKDCLGKIRRSYDRAPRDAQARIESLLQEAAALLESNRE